jgi:hypothetical protein
LPQLIIGVLIIAGIIWLLGVVLAFVLKLIAFTAVNFFAMIDMLFGSWRIVPPYISWGILGVIIGTFGYFIIREKDKLNRPEIGPYIIGILCFIIVFNPIIGAVPLKSGSQKALTTEDVINESYPMKIEFTVESTTRRPEAKVIRLPRAGYYAFDVYDKSIFNTSSNTNIYPLFFDFGNVIYTTNATSIFETPVYIDGPCTVSIKYTSAYVQNMSAHLRIRELTQTPAKYITIKLNQSLSLSPNLPYADNGACPFECCVYREWIAKEDITMLAEMDENASVSFLAVKGEIVTAETGVVITTKAGTAQLLKPVSVDNVQISKDYIVYVLSYTGEGFYKVWYDGKTLNLQEGSDFKMINLPETVWWVKIINSHGQVGWSRHPELFDNKDACG